MYKIIAKLNYISTIIKHCSAVLLKTGCTMFVHPANLTVGFVDGELTASAAATRTISALLGIRFFCPAGIGFCGFRGGLVGESADTHGAIGLIGKPLVVAIRGY